MELQKMYEDSGRNKRAKQNLLRRFIHQRYVHQDTIKLRYNRESKWQEMIRRRKQFTYSHEVAEQFEKHFSLEWDKGLEIITKSDLPWDKAKSIHYRKHPVQSVYPSNELFHLFVHQNL